MVLYIEINKIAWVMDRTSENDMFFDMYTYEICNDSEVSEVNDRYILIPAIGTYPVDIRRKFIEQNNYLNAEKFTDEINDPNRFHWFINDMGMYNDFVEFQKTEAAKAAVEWCEKNGINYSLKERRKNK